MRPCGIWFACRRSRARLRCRCWRFGRRNGAFSFLFRQVRAPDRAGTRGNRPCGTGRWRSRRSGRSALWRWRFARSADGLCCCAPAGRSVHFQDGDGAEVRIGDVSTPLTCGVLRPLILLPANARDWDEPRLRAVLLHESAHVRRRDCLAKYVAQGVASIVVVESAGLDDRGAPESRARVGLRRRGIVGGRSGGCVRQRCCWMWRVSVPVRWFSAARWERTSLRVARALCAFVRVAPEMRRARRAEPPSRFRCFLC